jgi:hypothetical protein
MEELRKASADFNPQGAALSPPRRRHFHFFRHSTFRDFRAIATSQQLPTRPPLRYNALFHRPAA